MLRDANKKVLISFGIFLIIFLIPVVSKATTKLSNTTSTTHHRMKRPLINRLSTTAAQHNRNITHPRIIERIIEPLTTVTNLPKITTSNLTATITKPTIAKTTPTTTTTSTTAATPTKTLSKMSITKNDTKLRNNEMISENITEIQNIGSVFKMNSTDEYREQQLNEKNSSQTTSTMASIITAAIPVANNLDFYLDPINPDSSDEMVDHVNEIANLTEGYDSFLINENINAFTTGTTLCPTCKCGVKTMKKIIGGSVTARNEHPWIVLLTYNQQFFCAGSLINNLYVVTAAHCTSTFEKNQIMVHAQDIRIDTEKTYEVITRRVSNVYRPLSFNQNTFFNDISLIKLAEPIDISNGLIRPICLPIDKTSFVGKIGSLTGWRLNNQNGMSLQITRMVNTTILSNRQCRNTLVGKLIAPTMICSSSSAPIMGTECRGDSGGPLMVTQKGRSRLAGVVSWGLGCTRKNSADVFTRTTKFNGWLRKLSQGACWCN